MNHFTNRQVIVVSVLSMGFGALFVPSLKSVAQPSESKPESSTAQNSATPQPLAPVSASAPTPAPISAGTSRTVSAIGTITGQGTTGYVSKFTGANAIGNSVLFENAGKIGIGTTTPPDLFSVTGVGTNDYVILGYNSGTGNAILGKSLSGIGLHGIHTNTSSDSAGVQGETASSSANATGVQGISQASTSGATSAGVRGINNGTNAAGYGVYGSHNGGGSGVYGTTLSGYGVAGDSKSGSGVSGRHILTTGTGAGVQGGTNSTDANATGVLGIVNPSSPGSSSAGVRGINNGTSYSGIGVYGSQAGSGTGVYGISPSGTGVQGKSTSSTGVQGVSTSGTGVQGVSTSGIGAYGYSNDNYGSYGYSLNNVGTYGYSYNDTGVYGGSSKGYAGYFQGNVMITGNLAKASGSFKIDHPQHPATEYLSHSFVESPDMMNVYNGNITTDAKGEAVVTLPEYFQSLNRDFRYQLTPIGKFAQAIVGQKIQGNHFLVRTDKPNVEVSWQVTGIRNDAYARQHRIRVEENKTGADRGKYLYPAGFGFGSDKQIGFARPRLAKR